MKIKGPNPSDMLSSRGNPTLLALLQTMHLKRLYRQGWLKRGVPESACESVADHSFGVAMLALLAPAPADIDGRLLDRGRAVLLATVHELGEIYAGDITPVDGVSKEEKNRRERESVERLAAGLDPETAASIRELWEEFESERTPEARFVRMLDRLEMGVQAAVYRAEGFPRMEEFLASAERAATDPELRDVLRSATASDTIGA
jgi:putative hydrolase of HD superfamily